MNTTKVSNDELLARFAFWRVVGVGPGVMAECLREFGGIREMFAAREALPPALQSLVLAADWKGAEQDLLWLSQPDHHLLLLGEESFPSALGEIPQVPPFLFVKGNAEILVQPQLAIVGSRNPTHYGIKAAQKFSEELAQAGLIITSGLALGIDGVCHQAVVDCEKPTVGVLAVGLDQVYPKRHQALAEEILSAGGALVSEYGVGKKAIAENFPRRNRIISGLSLGVLVIEATIKSGTLITAQYAVEQGREVFAIPGSIFQSLAQGCHHLIQQGAKCVWESQHILDELGLSVGSQASMKFPEENFTLEISLEEQQVLNLLNEIPQSFDVLLARLDCSSEHLQAILSQLMLRGLASQTWHGYHRLQACR